MRSRWLEMRSMLHPLRPYFPPKTNLVSVEACSLMFMHFSGDVGKERGMRRQEPSFVDVQYEDLIF